MPRRSGDKLKWRLNLELAQMYGCCVVSREVANHRIFDHAPARCARRSDSGAVPRGIDMTRRAKRAIAVASLASKSVMRMTHKYEVQNLTAADRESHRMNDYDRKTGQPLSCENAIDLFL
jgi:hypothetical protein